MENVNYSDELQHHGIMGMKWGQRRYQNKDGSLTAAGQKRYNKEVEKLKKETAKVKAAEKVAANRKKTQSKLDKLDAKKQALEERKKALKEEKYGKKKKGDSDENSDETPEQRKERLLKSSDPKELYKYKDELSTLELNERINRIDTENRLQSKIVEEHKTTGLEYMDKARKVIDTSTNLFKSVDSAYSTVSNSAIGKTLMKQLGIEPPKKTFNAEDFINKARANKLSIKELKEGANALKDLNTAEQQKKQIDKGRNEAKAAEKKARESEKKARDAEQKQQDAQKQVDDYNKRWRSGKSDDKVTNADSRYNKSGDDLSDNKTSTGKASKNRLGIDSVDHINLDDVDIVGEGRSRNNNPFNRKETVVDAEYGKDYWDLNTSVKNTSFNSVTNSESYAIGQSYIAGLIELKD